MTIGKWYRYLVYLEAKCLKVFQNVIERPTQIIIGNWTKIVHNLRGCLDNIKGNMQQIKLQILDNFMIYVLSPPLENTFNHSFK